MTESDQPFVSDKPRDWIFPVVTARPDGSDDLHVDFKGTGFLLKGSGGLAITAGHVAESLGSCALSGGLLADDSGGWSFAPFDSIERYPGEDLARCSYADRRSRFGIGSLFGAALLVDALHAVGLPRRCSVRGA